MKIQFRLPQDLLAGVRADLERPHSFAAERVGVLYCRFNNVGKSALLILGHHYVSLPDDQYIEDQRFGAVIGPEAFRDIIQHVYDDPVGAFHVHMHPGKGKPKPSGTDKVETAKFVPDFFHGRPDVPHGALILTKESISGRVWLREDGKPKQIDEFRLTGFPMKRIRGSI